MFFCSLVLIKNMFFCLSKTMFFCSSVFQSQRGFKSIGYHFVVRLDGEVERGRFPNAEIRGHRDYAAKITRFYPLSP